MTGQNLVDAVVSRLGMSLASTTTVPSTAQILEWVNTSIKYVVRKYGKDIPQILCSTADLTDITNCGEILAVYDVVLGVNATYLPLNEIYTNAVNNREDKPHWTYTPSGAVDVAPDVTDTSITVLPNPSGASIIFYVWMADDVAVGDTVVIPDGYIQMVIDRATAYGLMSEGRDQAAIALLGGNDGKND